MRIYSNIEECYKETIRNVAELGSVVKLKSYQNIDIEGNDDYQTKQLIGQSFKLLNNVTSRDILDQIRKIMGPDWADWAVADFFQRVAMEHINPGEAYQLTQTTEQYWSKFLNKAGKQDYTYNERLGVKIELIIEELKRDPNSRRAFLNIWQSRDLIDAISLKRVPCSLGYIFLIRNNQLHLTYIMRSSDVMELFLIDLYMAQCIKEYIAQKLHVEPGNTTFFTNNLHVYKKDIKDVF